MILPGFPMPFIMGKGGFDPNTPLGTFFEEEGGYYIGPITYADSRTFALFTPNKAQGQNNSLQWKAANTASAGTQSADDGLANSNAMNNAAHPAAFFCRGLTILGLNDFYLPARNELPVMYNARDAIIGPDSIDQDTTFYWSSTEDRDIRAWTVRFSGNMVENDVSKTNTRRVRAIRRLAI